MAQAIISTLENPPASNILQQRATEFSLEKSVAEYRKILNI